MDDSIGAVQIIEPLPVPTTGRSVAVRRRVFASLVGGSILGLIALMAASLSAGGLSVGEGLMLVCFAATLPWTVIGFWNAAIGLWLMRVSRDPVAAVCPIAPGNAEAAPAGSTAILSVIRNEAVDRVVANLDAMIADLARSGHAAAFSLYVLSDTSDPAIAGEEEQKVGSLAGRWADIMAITYRRRPVNTGFKAGNIRDFCDNWGARYDYALVLDADSYMSAAAVLDLVRKMDANPRLGILQSLVVGLPTTSAFARVFQFGMRLGMRSYTIGSAWWQDDCGPYWGHNAVIRLGPFIAHCALPVLPGRGPLSGPVLSHDQVEAVLMRRAGYEVRVLPQETESFEENPPDLLEFIRRDLRWCQGNLQYLKLLGLPGLLPVSWIQLVLAILMFVSAPAWLAFMTLAATLAAFGGAGALDFDATTGLALFVVVITMVFAPKIATVVDILCRPDLRRGFGGAGRLVAGTAAEMVFSALLAPIMAVAVSVFIAGLPFGRAIGWGAQMRDGEDIPLRLGAAKLWPQTLFGVAGIAFAATRSLDVIWPLLPIIAGPALALPFALATARRDLGRLALSSGFWRLPEETKPPACLSVVGNPALLALGTATASAAGLGAGGAGLAPAAVEGESG